MRADLASLQQRFADAVTDNNVLTFALNDLTGDPELNRERFACYRANVQGVWQQSCASAYPVLRKLLGKEFFDQLVLDYGLAHPSQSGDLTEFGAAMPEFISGVASCAAYPYLSDVAALEWQVHRAYFEKHHSPVSLEEFATMPPDRLSDLTCALQPCCALMQSDWSVAAIWQAHQADEPAFPAEFDRRSTSLVWRPSWQANWNVQVSSISAGGFAALSALRNGCTLGEAVQQALDSDPGFAVQSELADWLQKQLIISITLN